MPFSRDEKPAAEEEVSKIKGVHVFFAELQMEIKGEYANGGNLNLNRRQRQHLQVFLEKNSFFKPLGE